MVKKRWLKLGLVAAALLLIPRRSSQQSQDIEAAKSKKSKSAEDK